MITALAPQRTAKMYPGKRGLDRLGLDSVSINQILRIKVPGTLKVPGTCGGSNQ